MTWKTEDEVTITYGTLVQAQKESFEMGEAAMKTRILDMMQDHVCLSCEQEWAAYLDNWLNGSPKHSSCLGILEDIALIKELIK